MPSINPSHIVLHQLLHGNAEESGFDDGLAVLLNLGQKDMLEASRLCQALQKQPLPELDDGIGNAIAAFFQQWRPSQLQQQAAPRRLFGFLNLRPASFQHRLQDYLQQLEAASADMLQRLQQLGLLQDDVERTSIALEDYQTGLERVAANLDETCALLVDVRQGLLQQIAAIEGGAPARAQELRQELLYALEQHLSRLQLQHTVTQQALQAIATLQSQGVQLTKNLADLRYCAMSTLALAHGVAQMCDQSFALMKNLQQHQDQLGFIARQTLAQTQLELDNLASEKNASSQLERQQQALEKMQQTFAHGLQILQALADGKAAARKPLPVPIPQDTEAGGSLPFMQYSKPGQSVVH